MSAWWLVGSVGVALAKRPPKVVEAPPAPAPAQVDLGYALVPVPPGPRQIGCTPGQGPCAADAAARPVVVGALLLVGRTEVPRSLWETVMGSVPPEAVPCGADCPVTGVRWDEAIAFANALSVREGLAPCYTVDAEGVRWESGTACPGYRLLTEAEWESAARGADDAPFSPGADPQVAGWVGEAAGGPLHPVGQRAPNVFGLHDLTGNAAEWVWDWYGPVEAAGVVDALGAPTGERRVVRGGHVASPPADARVSTRDSAPPGEASPVRGLRLVRSIP
jgi:sulfatase modifying factor 1